MNINSRQISAAMKLSGLNNKSLSDGTGISLATITKVLQDAAKDNTKQQVIDYIESQGIEFIDNGVRMHPKVSVEQLEGKVGFNIFMQDVRAHASNPNVDICVSGVDESLFDKWHDDVNRHVAIMNKLHSVSDFKFRIIVKEGDNNHVASGYARYREIPKNQFHPTAVYIYADKKAEIIFDRDNVSIFITNSPKMANAYRATFNNIWENL